MTTLRALTLSQIGHTSNTSNINMAGVNHIRQLPTEMIERIASFMSPTNFLAFRLTNKICQQSTESLFGKICYTSVHVKSVASDLKRCETAIDGWERYIKNLAVEGSQFECLMLQEQKLLKNVLAKCAAVSQLALSGRMIPRKDFGLGSSLVNTVCSASYLPNLARLTLSYISLPDNTLSQILRHFEATLKQVTLTSVETPGQSLLEAFRWARDDAKLLVAFAFTSVCHRGSWEPFTWQFTLPLRTDRLVRNSKTGKSEVYSLRLHEVAIQGQEAMREGINTVFKMLGSELFDASLPYSRRGRLSK